MALPGGPWDLQEAITEQRMATRTATTPLTLHLDKAPAVSPTPQTSSQRGQLSKLRPSGKPTSGTATTSQLSSHSLRLVQGDDVIKTIDITRLLAGDHEIRLVPPTRATLLYSDPAQPSTMGGSGTASATSRLSPHTDSQEGSQTGSQMGSQNKRNCFLKLCFHSLSDLKAASQAFLRLGLRCKTQFKTQNRSLSRTSSVSSGPPSARSPYPEHGASIPNTPNQHYGALRPATAFSPADETSSQARSQARSYSPRAPAQAPQALARVHSPYHAAAGPSVSKRAYTEMAQGDEDDDEAYRRRRSVGARDGAMPGQQRASLSADSAASPWSNGAYQHADEPLRWSHSSVSPNASRTSSVLQSRLSDLRAEEETPLAAASTEKPPPRRELPPSIQRHISQTPSQIDGGDEHRTQPPRRRSRDPDARLERTPARQTAVAETEAQTEEPFVDPATAFMAGMELFQGLNGLKDQMLKECLDATRRLGEGGFVEEEARLIACYAIEFRTRFLETCAQKAGLFFRETKTNSGAPVGM